MRTNHDVVITAMAGLSDRDEALRTGIDKLNGKTDQVAGNLAALTTQQQSLYEAAKTNHDVVVAKLADVSDTQAQLQAGVSSLSGKADALASTQNDVQRTLQSHSETTTASVAALNNGQAALQQAVQAAEKNLGDRTIQTAADLKTSIAGQQAALQQTINTSQQALQSGIDNLGQATQRVASDIAVLATGQGALGQTLRAHSDKVNEQVATLANAQKEMKANLDTLTATTGQTSLDVLALGKSQTNLTQTVQAGVADLGTRTDKLAAGQNSLQDTLNRQGQALSGQMAKMADSQQQMQSGLDALTATTGQTALDVLAMTAQQDAVRAALQSHAEASRTQMTTLADNQQQMQGSLDTVTAITGQASLDALALNNNQGQLGQAVQTGRQEMASRLAVLAQEQQNSVRPARRRPGQGRDDRPEPRGHRAADRKAPGSSCKPACKARRPPWAPPVSSGSNSRRRSARTSRP